MSSSKKSHSEIELIVTQTANQRIREILDYVESQFGKKSKEKLLRQFIKGFNQLSKFPKSGKKSKSQEKYFQIVLNKQTSFYYQLERDKIYIMTAFDNRMDESSR